jgi:histidine triad (HIT) family protein
MSCLFCKIVEGQIPSTPVYQDEKVYAFADINPVAPTHVLIVSREHFNSLDDTDPDSKDVLGHLMLVTAEIARQKKLGNGYRVVINTGEDGGQTVEHLHVHLIGGRPMAWPPG